MTVVAEFATGSPTIDRGARLLECLAASDLAGAESLVRAELATGDPGLATLTSLIIRTMQADDLRVAGDLARITARLRLPGHLPPDDGDPSLPFADERRLSAGKLRHDSDQLRHLRSRGILGSEAQDVVAGYERITAELDRRGPETRIPLTDEHRAAFGSVYGRLVHVRDTPRVPRALSMSWHPRTVEDDYLGQRLGVVVIDDFLGPDALVELQQFCLESTVWNANRYPNARLGSFFDSGFNCPLLLQIAEELRESFPRMIGERHRLRQLWGFKYPPRLPPDSTIHADFAAVNVNFWITPEHANREPDGGGLLIYDIDAPRDWDFPTYNERLDVIKDFLRRNGAKVVRIPYRENRAVIFDSDLFHATARLDFDPAYVHRRVNVTMLYGVREHDDAHGVVAASATAPARSAWRSPALGRARRP